MIVYTVLTVDVNRPALRQFAVFTDRDVAQRQYNNQCSAVGFSPDRFMECIDSGREEAAYDAFQRFPVRVYMQAGEISIDGSATTVPVGEAESMLSRVKTTGLAQVESVQKGSGEDSAMLRARLEAERQRRESEEAEQNTPVEVSGNPYGWLQ